MPRTWLCRGGARMSGDRRNNVGIIRAVSGVAPGRRGGYRGVDSGRRLRRAGWSEQSSFLERLIGVDVDLRALYAFVAEPQGDGGGVDSGVEQPHGRGVAKDVR